MLSCWPGKMRDFWENRSETTIESWRFNPGVKVLNCPVAGQSHPHKQRLYLEGQHFQMSTHYCWVFCIKPVSDGGSQVCTLKVYIYIYWSNVLQYNFEVLYYVIPYLHSMIFMGVNIVLFTYLHAFDLHITQITTNSLWAALLVCLWPFYGPKNERTAACDLTRNVSQQGFMHGLTLCWNCWHHFQILFTRFTISR